MNIKREYEEHKVDVDRALALTGQIIDLAVALNYEIDELALAGYFIRQFAERTMDAKLEFHRNEDELRRN